MKKIFFLIFFLSFLSFSSEHLENRLKIIKLENQLKLINLINGLNLNNQQIKELLDISERYNKMREKYIKESNETINEAISIFQRFKEELIRNNGEYDRRIAGEVHKYSRKLKEMGENIKRERERYVEEIKNVLTENQLYLIGKFTPCLVPPSDWKNPVRVGQTGTSEFGTKALERIRKLPDERYEKTKDFIFERYFNTIKKRGKELSSDEIEKIRKNFFNVVETARNMSDVDFEIKKKELSEKLVHFNKNKNPVNIDKRIEKYFLSPDLPEILKEITS